MTSPVAANRRTGVVTAVNATSPPTVTVTIGGDTASSIATPYLDSYAPLIGDTVVILSNQGTHVVLGRAGATTFRRAYAQTTTAAGSITTTAVTLLTATPAITVDGSTSVQVQFSFNGWTSTVAGDRAAFALEAQLGAGAFAAIAKFTQRNTATNFEMGTALSTLHINPAAGAWTYRATIVRVSGTGTLSVSAVSDSPMTLTAERWVE